MANELPYCPFFIGDFLVAVTGWPTDRVGAYALALFYQFEKGGIPDDDGERMRIFHAPSRAVARRLWAEIKEKFYLRDGKYWNPKMEAVRAEAVRQWQDKQTRARNGAKARWGKGANATGNAQASAQAEHEHSLSNANQNHNQKTPPEGSRREPAVMDSATQSTLTEVVRDIPEGDRFNAKAFHDAVESRLRYLGWTVEREYRIDDRGDGRAGYVDLVVHQPVPLAIELDRGSARQKSLDKLNTVARNGFAGVVLCRDAANGRWVMHGAVSVWESAPIGDATRHTADPWNQREMMAEVARLEASGKSHADAMAIVFDKRTH